MDKRTNRSHYKIIGGKETPKLGYNTENEALNAARNLNIMPKTIHKFVAYKCISCGKWHVGRNNTILTDEEKEKIRKKMFENKENIWKINLNNI